MGNPAPIDKAIARYRREAYRAAVSMTTADLQRAVPDYLAATGEREPSGEALVQARVIAGELARRGTAS
jgi:hypothetical protein